MDLKTFIDSVNKLDGNKIDIDRWNEQIQLSIVKSTSNQLLLTYFVNNSKYKYIHYRALDKIDDEEMLMDIAMNNKSLYWGDYTFRTVSSYLDPAYYNSEKAFSKITDKHKLIEIVKSIDHELYNLKHLAKFIEDDNDVWADIAVDANLEYHKIFALNRITSKKVLACALAKCDIDKLLKKAEYIRDNGFEERVKLITDEVYLKSILTGHEDDEEFLKNIVLTYKNRHVRTLAIAQIKDENFLKEMACEGDRDFRYNAIKNIHDESFLKGVALNEKDLYVRRCALEKIHDESFLKGVVLNDDDSDVRSRALENIHDESFLKGVALDDDSWIVRESSLKNIHDESFLKHVALNDEDYDVRLGALDNIPDENFLRSVALNDEDSHVREGLLRNIHDIDFLKSCIAPGKEEFEDLIVRIDDEDFLKDIVRDSENYSEKERFHALKNITDIDFLRDVALNDFGDVCLYASLKTGEYDIITQKSYDNFPKDLLYEILHENINNEMAIKLMEYVEERDWTSFVEEITDDRIFLAVLDRMCPRIALYCNTTVFNNRIRKISDEDLLKDVFLNCKNDELRSWVASKVDDEDFFREVYFKSDDDWLKATALENIHDQNLLCDVAVNGDDLTLISSAVGNIVDGDVLKGIYFSTDSQDLKEIIVSKTDDVDVATDYSFNGEDSQLRKVACKRITDENVLKNLFLKEESTWVRDLFSQNIHDDDFFMKIIHGDYDEELKVDALCSLENEENLLDVALHFKDPGFCKHAINQIRDESALRDICEMTPTSKRYEQLIEHARKKVYERFFKSEAQLYLCG